MTKRKTTQKRIIVWDLPSRVFHWILAVAFTVSAYSAFQDKYGDYAAIHLWSGFTILTLVCWRILWGLVGSETSRFKSFLKSPKTALHYARMLLHSKTYSSIGHNPLGGYSVLLMLFLLLVQAALGLFASDGMFFKGPLAGYASAYTSDITELHEVLGYILFAVVGVHLLVILFYQISKKTNLVLPMLSGKKSVSNDVQQPHTRSAFFALLLLIIVGAVLYFQVF